MVDLKFNISSFDVELQLPPGTTKATAMAVAGAFLNHLQATEVYGAKADVLIRVEGVWVMVAGIEPRNMTEPQAVADCIEGLRRVAMKTLDGGGSRGS